AGRLDDSFLQTVDLFDRCAGRVAVTGTGKSADVGQKIAGTLNSTGTRAYVLDATRAVHGDLGMVHPNAVVLALSHSGAGGAFVLARMREFTREDFARYHPAGSLGRKLVKVEAVMRRADELRLAPASATVRAVFAHPRRRGRRTGAVMLTDADGRLRGLFTDS